MNYEAMFKKYSEEVALYWERSRQRWSAIQDKASKNTYKADDLASDVVASWVDTINLWSGLTPSYPSGVIPTVFIDLDTGSHASFYIPDDAQMQAAPGALFPCTALGQIGGTGAIAATNVVAEVVSPCKVKVSVNLPAPSPPAGLYQGLVADAKPLAVVIVKVS